MPALITQSKGAESKPKNRSNEMLISHYSKGLKSSTMESSGLLLKGLDCQLYEMWLEHNGVYVCRELQSFFLPCSMYEIMLCPSIFSTFLALKEKINDLIKHIQARPKVKSRLVVLTHKCYDSPVLVKNPLIFSIQNYCM